MQKETIKKNNRTVILINKNFQLNFSKFFLVPILLIQIMFWLTIEFFFHAMIKKGEAYHLPVGHNFYKLIAHQKKELMLILVCSSILVSILMFVWGLYISHRIAGPFYKLEKYLKNAKSLDEVKNHKLEFRKNDFFLNIPKAFNEFIERIS